MQDLEDVTDGGCVYIGNSTTTKVMGKGKTLLKFTFGKLLSLRNVLYVPPLRKNLISGILLNKVGLKIVFRDDRVVISHNGILVGKGY